MTKRIEVVETKLLNSDEVVTTSVDALSPREKRMHGLTKARKHRSQKRRIDTTHARWA